MCGLRISGGSGDARRVGRRAWRIRSAGKRKCQSQAPPLELIGNVLLPNFSVRSSGGASRSLKSGGLGAIWSGIELVNHTSGKTSRSGRTWARERHGVRMEV